MPAEQLSPVATKNSWSDGGMIPGKVLKSGGENSCGFDESSKFESNMISKG